MKRTTLAATALIALLAAPGFAQGNPGAHFVENWDLDEDGTVTLEEARERRGDIFHTFDADEDGVLNAEEYEAFDEARAADMEANGQGRGRGQGQGHGQGMGRGEPAANGMLRRFTDTDGDGQVTREEFLATTDAWFARLDRNGDGVVTTEDFGQRG